MTNQSNAMTRIRAYMEKHGIDPLDPRDDLPVGLDRPESVPISGSVHIGSGNTASREEIDRKFRKLKF